LAYYGIQDNSDAFIVASFNPETLETVRTAVEGQVTKIDSMSDQLDLKKLKKLYGIEGSQAFVDSDIIYTIISTLSIKDVKVSESKF
jgi:Kinase binding protein CGI-121